MVTITGTGFQTRYPIDPNTPHPWPTPEPTVTVSFDGRQASRVVVLSSTSLTCLAPSHNHGASVVTVQNLDVDGAAIPGEVVSRSGLLTFARVDLTIKDDLVRIVEALVVELQRQVIENVSTTVSVDYDSDPDAVSFAGVDLAKLPAIAITGPESIRDRFYDGDPRPTTTNNNGQYERRATFETQDLQFRLVCLDDKTVRSLNLHALVTKFFNSNNYIVVQRDPTDASKGSVRYELEGGPFVTTSVNNSNDIRAFTGTVVVKGYQFEDAAGFPEQLIAERSEEAIDVRASTVLFE